jgi:NitT/TauT family transport system permease protein
MSKDAILWARPPVHREPLDSSQFGVIEKPLSTFERLYNYSAVRKGLILMLLVVTWEAGARMLDNELLFPTFVATVDALFTGLASGDLVVKIWASLKVLLMGYAMGIALAAMLTAIAISSKIGTDFLETLTSMFNPLPAIALLPIALIWFGLGNGSLVFVLVHSVLWAVALNTHSGFLAVSNTLRMVGRNYGLGGMNYVSKILIPAAFPSILTGLKIGWAFAWRTLIASELVFGVSSGSGGLGWFIYENKNQLEIPNVFAGLLTVILIGLIIENLVFRTIENHTVRKWGMQA